MNNKDDEENLLKEDQQDIESLVKNIEKVLKEKDASNNTLKEKYRQKTEDWLKEYCKYASGSFWQSREEYRSQKSTTDRSQIEKILKTGLDIVERARKEIMGEEILYLTIELKNLPIINKKGIKDINEINAFLDNFITTNKKEELKLYIISDINKDGGGFLKPSEGSIRKKDERKGKGVMGDPIFNLNKTKIMEAAKQIDETKKTVLRLKSLEEKVSEMRSFFISNNKNTFFTAYINKRKKINTQGIIEHQTTNRNRYLQWMGISSIPTESGQPFFYKKEGEEVKIEKWKKYKKVKWFAYSMIEEKDSSFSINAGQLFEAYLHAINLDNIYKEKWNIDDAFYLAKGHLPFYKGPDVYYDDYEELDGISSFQRKYAFQLKVLDNASIAGNTVFNAIVFLNSILSGKDWLKNNSKIEGIPLTAQNNYYKDYKKMANDKNMSMEKQLLGFFTDFFNKQ